MSDLRGLNDSLVNVSSNEKTKTAGRIKLTGIVEEKRIVGLRILHKPMHGTEDVCLGGLAHRVLLVIGKNDHVLSSVAKALVQISRQVPSIVDTSTQLAFLVEIVDTNQQCLSLSRAARVLEVVTLWSAVTERDRLKRRRCWGTITW